MVSPKAGRWFDSNHGTPAYDQNSLTTKRKELMGRYQIKRDKADEVFSWYIRLRDMECKRCHSPVELNNKGLPITHQCSHFMGRGKEATRFNENNGDTLCGGCHQFFTANPALHYQWQVEQKGQELVDKLVLWSNQYKKKDRTMDFLYWKTRLKEDFNI